jgi:hydrogenase nickel incorporation protein HypB
MNEVEIKLRKNILAKNEETAAHLRELFAQHRLMVINMLSSPGSGKTTLLEKTARAVGHTLAIAVIAGDLQTERDAIRIRNAGAAATQINTGRGCHLSARMVADALPNVDLDAADVLFIENVGNLVCPASYDLGEDLAVVLASVTEGDDKPAKYPTAIHKADLIVLNKIDLAPYTNFSAERFRLDVRKIKPTLDVLEISCTQGAGLQSWFEWLKTKVEQKQALH